MVRKRREKKISHSSPVIINIKLKSGHFSSSSNRKKKLSQRSIIREKGNNKKNCEGGWFLS
jgi:hypothetical protein